MWRDVYNSAACTVGFFCYKNIWFLSQSDISEGQWSSDLVQFTNHIEPEHPASIASVEVYRRLRFFWGGGGALGRSSGISAPLHGVIKFLGIGLRLLSPLVISKLVEVEENQYR